MRDKRWPTSGMCFTKLSKPLLLSSQDNQLKKLVNANLQQVVNANLQKLISIECLKLFNGSLGLPCASTLLRSLAAVCLKSWLCLTTTSVNKVHEQDQKVLGHQEQKRKNFQHSNAKEELSDWKQTMFTRIPRKTNSFSIK